MDILSYYYGSTEGQSAIPAVKKEGFAPPFNNILYIFQNFDFEKFSELFHRNFNSEKSNDHLIEFAMRVLALDPFSISEVEVLPDEQGFTLKWSDGWTGSANNPASINPGIVAYDIFSTELGASKKVFMAKDQSLPEPYMKSGYYSSVFQQLDQILNLFYRKRENYTPFENELGRFFYELYDLTYPYFTEDSDLQYLRRVYDNIKKRKSEPARNEESSSIEKIVDLLIAQGVLKQQSKINLIDYLKDGVDGDVSTDSIHWLDTAYSFTLFISALVVTGQYQQEGNIPWNIWRNTIQFPKNREIKETTFKSLYQKARKSSDNIFINRINQALSSSLA